MADETKACPYCGEQIQAKATMCRFCKKNLSTGESPGGPPGARAAAQKKSQEKGFVFGCGGQVHSGECAVCERRGYPSHLLSRVRTTKDKRVFQGSIKRKVITAGLGLCAFLTGGLLWEFEAFDPLVNGICLVVLGLLGLACTYNALFVRRATVVDCGNRVVVDAYRALFSKNRETLYPFSEIALVCLDNFRDRMWTNEEMISEELKANVSLKMRDGRFLSFGTGDPVRSRILAEKLHELIGVHLEVTEAEKSPTSDYWGADESDK